MAVDGKYLCIKTTWLTSGTRKIENLLQEVQFESFTCQNTAQWFTILCWDIIIQLWKVIAAAIILSVTSRNTPFTLQGNPPGMCACSYLIGSRNTLLDYIMLQSGLTLLVDDPTMFFLFFYWKPLCWHPRNVTGLPVASPRKHSDLFK